MAAVAEQCSMTLSPLRKDKPPEKLVNSIVKLLNCLGVRAAVICSITVEERQARVTVMGDQVVDYLISALAQPQHVMNVFDLRRVCAKPHRMRVKRIRKKTKMVSKRTQTARPQEHALNYLLTSHDLARSRSTQEALQNVETDKFVALPCHKDCLLPTDGASRSPSLAARGQRATESMEGLHEYHISSGSVSPGDVVGLPFQQYRTESSDVIGTDSVRIDPRSEVEESPSSAVKVSQRSECKSRFMPRKWLRKIFKKKQQKVETMLEMSDIDEEVESPRSEGIMLEPKVKENIINGTLTPDNQVFFPQNPSDEDLDKVNDSACVSSYVFIDPRLDVSRIPDFKKRTSNVDNVPHQGNISSPAYSPDQQTAVKGSVEDGALMLESRPDIKIDQEFTRQDDESSREESDSENWTYTPMEEEEVIDWFSLHQENPRGNSETNSGSEIGQVSSYERSYGGIDNPSQRSRSKDYQRLYDEDEVSKSTYTPYRSRPINNEYLNARSRSVSVGRRQNGEEPGGALKGHLSRAPKRRDFVSPGRSYAPRLPKTLVESDSEDHTARDISGVDDHHDTSYLSISGTATMAANVPVKCDVGQENDTATLRAKSLDISEDSIGKIYLQPHPATAIVSGPISEEPAVKIPEAPHVPPERMTYCPIKQTMERELCVPYDILHPQEITDTDETESMSTHTVDTLVDTPAVDTLLVDSSTSERPSTVSQDFESLKSMFDKPEDPELFRPGSSASARSRERSASRDRGRSVSRERSGSHDRGRSVSREHDVSRGRSLSRDGDRFEPRGRSVSRDHEGFVPRGRSVSGERSVVQSVVSLNKDGETRSRDLDHQEAGVIRLDAGSSTSDVTTSTTVLPDKQVQTP